MTALTRDLLLLLVLAAAAATVSARNSERVGAALDVRGHSPGGHDDVWYDADVRDLHRRFTFDNYEQSLTVRHPLIALMVRLPIRVYLRVVEGADRVNTMRAGLSMIAAGWVAMLFVTLRMAGCTQLDAALFSMLGLSSAAALFWFSVTETFALGSLTILPAVALVAASAWRAIPEWLSTAAGALSLSVTVTNGLFGGLAAWLLHPRRRFVQIAANAACVVLVLWGVQRFIYPSSGFPYGYDRSYRAFVLAADARTPIGPLGAFVFHGMVMPAAETIQRVNQENYRVLSVQRARPFSSGPAGILATIAWLLILVIGAWATRSAAVPASLRRFLWWSIGAQLALHLVFGEETFLYAMHYLPLLLVTGALGTLTHLRTTVRVCAVVLLISAIANNTQQLSRSIDLAQGISSQIVP